MFTMLATANIDTRENAIHFLCSQANSQNKCPWEITEFDSISNEYHIHADSFLCDIPDNPTGYILLGCKFWYPVGDYSDEYIKELQDNNRRKMSIYMLLKSNSERLSLIYRMIERNEVSTWEELSDLVVTHLIKFKPKSTYVAGVKSPTREKLKEMRKTMSVQQIADKHYVSVGTVYKWLQSNHLTSGHAGKPPTNVDKDKLVELFLSGMTYANIAEQLDVSLSTVTKLLRQLKLKRK